MNNYLNKVFGSIKTDGLRLLFLSAFVFLDSHVALASKWSGVDETVVEHYAEQAGRSPWKSLINTDQGDLLLFVFLLAGAVGGFIVGYYWRMIFVCKCQAGKDGSREHVTD